MCWSTILCALAIAHVCYQFHYRLLQLTINRFKSRQNTNTNLPAKPSPRARVALAVGTPRSPRRRESTKTAAERGLQTGYHMLSKCLKNSSAEYSKGFRRIGWIVRVQPELHWYIARTFSKHLDGVLREYGSRQRRPSQNSRYSLGKNNARV